MEVINMPKILTINLGNEVDEKINRQLVILKAAIN